MGMRGIQTPLRTIRKKVFMEVAKVAFDSDNINDDIEARADALRKERETAGTAGKKSFFFKG